MGRSPCCDKADHLKKGPWTPEEDQKLLDYINKNGHGSWRELPKLAGLNRCGKSCRLRWTNYLRPDIKRGKFSEDEERIIIKLHSVLGNKWSKIAAHLPGRTDNEIKNFWNTHLRKKLFNMGIDPNTHMPRIDLTHLKNLSQLLGIANLGNLTTTWSNSLGLQADVTQVANIQLLQNLLQIVNANTILNMPNTNLLGMNSFPQLGGLVNGTSTLINMCPHLSGLGHATEDPQAHSDSIDFALWKGREFGGYKPEFAILNNSSSPSHNENEAKHTLPALISASPGNFNNQIESSSNPIIHDSTQSPTYNSKIFEAWEKLVDDETSDSYWKDILDLTRISD